MTTPHTLGTRAFSLVTARNVAIGIALLLATLTLPAALRPDLVGPSRDMASLFSVCYVTVPTMEVAERVASHLVARKAAACVNILPGVTSVYTWKGKVEKENELLLMIKTQTSIVPRLIAEVREVHPYDVPEVISVPMGAGHADYLSWVRENTDPDMPLPESKVAAANSAGEPPPSAPST
jgi:periplasmic divalent cation tolerance protein